MRSGIETVFDNEKRGRRFAELDAQIQADEAIRSGKFKAKPRRRHSPRLPAAVRKEIAHFARELRRQHHKFFIADPKLRDRAGFRDDDSPALLYHVHSCRNCKDTSLRLGKHIFDVAAFTDNRKPRTSSLAAARGHVVHMSDVPLKEIIFAAGIGDRQRTRTPHLDGYR